jgi:hypothetical protein
MISADICRRQIGLEPFITGYLAIISLFGRKHAVAISPFLAALHQKNGQIGQSKSL